MGRDTSRERSRSPSSKHGRPRHHDSSRDPRDKERKRQPGESERDSEKYERKRRRTPDGDDRRHKYHHHHRHDKHDKDRIRDQERPSGNVTSERRYRDTFVDEGQLAELRRVRETSERNPHKQEREQPQFRNEHEDAKYKEWLAKEDDFMLTQAKKRAAIRIREGRAKPIDALVVNLNLVEEDERQRVLGDDEIEGEEFYITELDEVINTLSTTEITGMKKDIEDYLGMEKSKRNREYWQAILVILNNYETQSASAPESRAVSNVADEIHKLLGSKTYEQLETLEDQIHAKLRGDEPVDVDYWQQLLRSLKIWKAKARVRAMHEPILKSRPKPPPKPSLPKPAPKPFDPSTFTDDTVHDELLEDNDAFTQAAQSMFDTETTRIVEEGVETEENFNVEADDVTIPEPSWKDDHRPRKPKFFNRIVMGYEWNKYNQTHYDEANPPPKVVQGYKFNIFYPNLVDPSKAPTYKVERNRQKRRYVGGGGGTSAGEDETCIIRFMAGPPYLDVAFRIIDRDWDYSSRFNRGFKSSFDKGILQLHFQFKKVFYRK